MKKVLFTLLAILATLAYTSESIFAGAFTPSRYSTTSSQITFTNNSVSTSLAIYWIDLDGNERYYTTLQPRASYTQDTYIGHIWNVRNSSNSNLLGTYTSNSTYQQHTITPPQNGTTSPSYTTSASRIYFTNNSNVAVNINWIDQSGYEKNYRTLSPGESYTQDTYIDHVWIVRYGAVGTELGRTISTNSYQTYTVTQRFDIYGNNNAYGYNYTFPTTTSNNTACSSNNWYYNLSTNTYTCGNTNSNVYGYTTNNNSYSYNTNYQYSNNTNCTNSNLVYNPYTNSYTCGYTYGYTSTTPTYFQNTYPTGYNNGSNYNNGTYYNGNTNNGGNNSSWSYTVPVRQTYNYNNRNIITYEACDLYDGTYQDEGFYVTVSGLGNTYVETFRKKGTKIYFSTYETAPDGRLRLLRWVLSCTNGSVSQR